MKHLNPAFSFLFFALLLSAAAYGYSLIFVIDYFMDDPETIFNNAALINGSFFQTITSGTANRPLLMATLWIERNLWGLDYMSLKIVNVILLSLWGLIFYLFLKTVDRHRLPSAIPCLFALCFILHPIHHQAINTVIQRGVILSGIFSLLSYYFFIHNLNHDDRKSWLMSLMFFFLGVLSKEVCVFLPLSFLFLSFVLKKPFLKTILLSLPFFLICFTPILFNIFMHAGTQTVTPSVLEYFLAETKITLQYLWVSIFPYGLQYVFYVPTSKNPLEYGAWAAILVHLALIYSILRLGRSRSMAMVFGLTIYLAWIPESSFYPLEQLGYLHRMSIPLTFVFLFVYLALPLDRFRPQKIIAILSLLAIVYIGLTNFRSWQVATLERRALENLSIMTPYHTINSGHLCNLPLDKKHYKESKFIFLLRQKYPEMIDYYLIQLLREALVADQVEIKKRKINLLTNYLINLRTFPEILANTRNCLNLYLYHLYRWPYSSAMISWPHNIEEFVDLISKQMPVLVTDQEFFGKTLKAYELGLIYLGTYYSFHKDTTKYNKINTLLKQYIKQRAPKQGPRF